MSLRFFSKKGELIVLMIGLHVDDVLGIGADEHPEYQAVKESLRKEFNFKHWTEETDDKPLEFCGCKLKKSVDGSLRLHQRGYIKSIKPVTCSDNEHDRSLYPKEQSGLRALLGALQWPATQTSPHLCATVSLLCREVSQSRLETVQNANKALRFAKMNQDVGLLFQKLGDVKDLCMIAVSDAAWGVRKDRKSQGGYLVLKDAMNGKADQSYIVLDWRSFKLPRNSRSSLNSESQACAAAMRALDYLLLF